MNTYYCKLVNKGYVVEGFYRRGRSVKDIMDVLNMFQWPKGRWVVEEA